MEPKPFGLAVKAFVRDEEGRVLLLRRSQASKHFVGQWDLPGGKVDRGERFDESLLREVAEETALEVRLTGVAGAAEYEMEHVRAVLLFLEVRRVGGEVRLSREHDEYGWVLREELPQMDLSEQLRPFVFSYCRGTDG